MDGQAGERAGARAHADGGAVCRTPTRSRSRSCGGTRRILHGGFGGHRAGALGDPEVSRRSAGVVPARRSVLPSRLPVPRLTQGSRRRLHARDTPRSCVRAGLHPPAGQRVPARRQRRGGRGPGTLRSARRREPAGCPVRYDLPRGLRRQRGPPFRSRCPRHASLRARGTRFTCSGTPGFSRCRPR